MAIDDRTVTEGSDRTEISDGLIGRTISGYTFLKELGRGGMGVVYLAHDTGLDRQVAMKTLLPELTQNDYIVSSFWREAQTLAKLHHPNIVTVYNLADLEEHGKFIVMEYVEGETLYDLLKARGPLPLQQALPLLKQLLSALAYSHRKHVIHRDIKPKNVMLAKEDGDNLSVKVADFGLAKVLLDADETKSANWAGTLKYMAPEQKDGYADERSDIYSAGITCYEVLSGHTPAELNRSPLHQAIPSVPENLSDVIMKALETDPKERYQTSRAMLKALEECEIPDRPFNWKAPVLTGVAVLVLLVAVLVGPSLLPDPALLTISTVPPAASVFLGEEEIGSTPIEGYRVPNGPIRLHVALAGYIPFDTTLTPSAGQHVILDGIRLVEPESPVLTILSDPANANVTVNGSSVGVTPLTDFPIETLVSPGSPVAIEVRLAGFEPVDTLIRMEEVGDLTLSFSLDRSPTTRPEPPVSQQGTIILNAYPSGSIILDDVSRSSGSYAVTPGTHTVRCGGENLRSEKTITVTASGSQTLNCYFESLINVSTRWEEQRTGIAPAASVRIDGVFKTSGPFSEAFDPGAYRVEADFLSHQPYEVVGGQYIVKAEDGRILSDQRFTGSAYTVNVKPNFDKETHLISFFVREKASGGF